MWFRGVDGNDGNAKMWKEREVIGVEKLLKRGRRKRLL